MGVVPDLTASKIASSEAMLGNKSSIRRGSGKRFWRAVPSKPLHSSEYG